MKGLILKATPISAGFSKNIHHSHQLPTVNKGDEKNSNYILKLVYFTHVNRCDCLILNQKCMFIIIVGIIVVVVVYFSKTESLVGFYIHTIFENKTFFLFEIKTPFLLYLIQTNNCDEYFG